MLLLWHYYGPQYHSGSQFTRIAAYEVSNVRLGILGGTFDPVHWGHLLLAEYAREQARLDKVWFLPAALSPHKQDRQPGTDANRVAMLELATGGHAAFEISRLEIDRGGVSFTVDTLCEIRQQLPSAKLFFIMGGDSLADFRDWREPGQILDLATPLIVGRPGSPTPHVSTLAKLASPDRLAAIAEVQFTMPQIGISSSDIRHRVRNGLSIRYQVTRAVEKYIEANRLYIED